MTYPKESYCYFVEAPYTYGQQTVLAEALAKYAKDKYDRCIVFNSEMPTIIRELEKEADRLHDERPRCRKPKVSLVEREEMSYNTIYIDEWGLSLKKVVKIYSKPYEH